MYGTDIATIPAAQVAPLKGEAAFAGLQLEAGRLADGDDDELRERVGEFVGGVFYGMLLRELQESKLKGKYMHGGRGEECQPQCEDRQAPSDARTAGAVELRQAEDRQYGRQDRRPAGAGPALGQYGQRQLV